MDLYSLNNRANQRKKTLDLGSMVFGKVPPQAQDLEKAVLGAIMLERGAFVKVYEILKHFNFYSETHERIYKAFESLSKRGMPIDLLTVVEELKIKEELELVGGPYYISTLTNSVVSAANVENHARIILQKHVSRAVIRSSGEAISNAYEDSTDPFELLDETISKFKDISNELAGTSSVSIEKISMEITSEVETKSYNAKHDIEDTTAIYTGIPDWDRINGSLFKGGLYIVAARPAMGKGIHMVQCIVNMAPKYEVGVINGEMTNKQLITRIGCNIKSIDNFLWKKNPLYIQENEIEQVYLSMEDTTKLKLHLDDKNEINKVVNKIKLWVDKYGVQVVFADVLSKFKPPEEIAYRMTEVQKLNYVMDAFANCAKDCNIPIILYSHLNRELYKRVNKEPNMSDLKGSGNIEDFAFQVSLLHRPEYYEILEDEFGESTKGLIYQIVAKHREGETGRIKQKFLPQFSQMKSWDSTIIPNWNPVKEDTPLPF